MVARIKSSKAFSSGILSDLSEMALFVDNVARDKISDLTTNVIRQKLIEYTSDTCDIYNIPLEDYNGPPVWDRAKKNWISKVVKLPRIKKIPVMLVPKFIVRRELCLSSQEFYNKQITDFLIAEHNTAVGSLVQNLKSKDKITKSEIREKNPKSKSMMADLVADNPHLLEIYKDLARAEKSAMVNVKDDDISVAQACVDLEKALRAIPVGKDGADRYHIVAMHILTLCFYPNLILPKKEWEINGGRKRVDIVFTNAAESGFLSQRRDAENTCSTMLIVECKNYSKDILNPELDQLLGRFDKNRGYLGFITCRAIGDRALLTQRFRDYAARGAAYIIVLEDRDLIEILNHKKLDDGMSIDNLLHARFREIVA